MAHGSSSCAISSTRKGRPSGAVPAVRPADGAPLVDGTPLADGALLVDGAGPLPALMLSGAAQAANRPTAATTSPRRLLMS